MMAYRDDDKDILNLAEENKKLKSQLAISNLATTGTAVLKWVAITTLVVIALAALGSGIRWLHYADEVEKVATARLEMDRRQEATNVCTAACTNAGMEVEHARLRRQGDGSYRAGSCACITETSTRVLWNDYTAAREGSRARGLQTQCVLHYASPTEPECIEVPRPSAQ